MLPAGPYRPPYVGLIQGAGADPLPRPTLRSSCAADKYTIFSRKHARYRKPMHFVPKFTKVRHRRFTGLLNSPALVADDVALSSCSVRPLLLLALPSSVPTRSQITHRVNPLGF